MENQKGSLARPASSKRSYKEVPRKPLKKRAIRKDEVMRELEHCLKAGVGPFVFGQ
jgi:hypothetical protein